VSDPLDGTSQSASDNWKQGMFSPAVWLRHKISLCWREPALVNHINSNRHPG
jgi:hypothetical protein